MLATTCKVFRNYSFQEIGYFTTARSSGNILAEKLFSSDTHQSIKRRIVTERLTEIYTQMRLHVMGCIAKKPKMVVISGFSFNDVLNQVSKQGVRNIIPRDGEAVL